MMHWCKHATARRAFAVSTHVLLTHMYVYIYIYMHTRIYIYMYIYIHARLEASRTGRGGEQAGVTPACPFRPTNVNWQTGGTPPSWRRRVEASISETRFSTTSRQPPTANAGAIPSCVSATIRKQCVWFVACLRSTSGVSPHTFAAALTAVITFYNVSITIF